jgi:hypothetical protein
MMSGQYSKNLIFTILAFFFIPFSLHAQIYEVGPGKKFEKIADVPLDSLEPGDVVKIHYRKEPYHEKFILRRSGTKKRPIVITGVPKDGKLPIIDGSQAYQRQKDSLDQSGRWLIKVGDDEAGNYVHVKKLHLRNANNSKVFYELEERREYKNNAAGIFVRKGKHVLISGCIIHSCGNGVQTSSAPDVSHVTLSGSYIYDNGNHRDQTSYLQHNVYMCGTNTTIQFSRFGETHSDGHNIKDRGRETVIRYNWIQGSKNRQLDLVDHKAYGRSDAYVYGNVIVQGRAIHNNNMIYWGGDSGRSRSGTLYFFSNTVIGKAKKTRFVVVRFPDCSVEMKNNVFVGVGTLWNDQGVLKGSNNWFSMQIKIPIYFNLGFKGQRPGFYSTTGIPYFPRAGSTLINLGTNAVPQKVSYMPKPYTGGLLRPSDGHMDIGAYEFSRKSK